MAKITSPEDIEDKDGNLNIMDNTVHQLDDSARAIYHYVEWNNSKIKIKLYNGKN